MPIIGICGGTASGKSTIARNIKNLFSEKGAVIILSDSYYKDHSSFDFDSRSKINFDHPDSIDFELLIKNLIKLKSNKIVNEPIYSYKTHKRLKKTKKTFPNHFIILEGLHIFCNKDLIKLIDYGLFLDLDSEIRFQRRLERDIKERGRKPEEVNERFFNMCEPMYDRFIYPSRINADKILDMRSVKFNEIKKLLSEFI